MDEDTIKRLNTINRIFYQTTADEFDQTRGTAWPGWLRLLEYMPEKGQIASLSLQESPLRVLDVGCGNGRFGVFLAEQNKRIAYTGVDNNATLLNHAQQALTNLPNLADVVLEERDVVENPLTTGEYDLVVCFGVLHHIPGAARRLQFMREIAARVAPNGILAFACWRFYEYERFRARVVAWDADLAAQVEAGDHLLDWRRGERALRYCHYVNDAEHAALIDAAELHLIADYRADGEDGATNRYSILKRK